MIQTVLIVLFVVGVICWQLSGDIRFLAQGRWYRSLPAEEQERLKQEDPNWELNHGRPLSCVFVVSFFLTFIAFVAALSYLSSIGWIPQPND